jgi:hypothetical protein
MWQKIEAKTFNHDHDFHGQYALDGIGGFLGDFCL